MILEVISKHMHSQEHLTHGQALWMAVSVNNQPRQAVVLGRPPEGADYVRLPPLGAWSWSGPSFLPVTGRGFSVDDDFQAYPLSCESLPKP